MLLACGACGVRYSVPDREGEFLCHLCRRSRASPTVLVAEAPEPVKRPLVAAYRKRAVEREREEAVGRVILRWGVPAAVFVALGGAMVIGWLAFVSVIVFCIYVWAIRKLATALRNDPAPLPTCSLLAAVMMTMQAVSLVLLGGRYHGGTMLAAVVGGIFVFGVLVRYRLRLSMKSALVLTVGTAVETFVITVVFAEVIFAANGGIRIL